jgi:UDP-GlcNAc:undecaprenyl-phosphate/decaprenyl-phosphate GlcNAc-1-phosphate transferase
MLSIPDSYNRYLEYLPLFCTAVVVSLLLTPVVGWIARRFNIIAYPPSMRSGQKSSDFRHLEKQPTPLLGGAAVILPLILLTFISTNPSPELIALFIAISILFLMGIIDDIHELSGRTQLIFQIIAALFLCASVIDLTVINNPLGGTILLNQAVYQGAIGSYPYSIVLPGDLILFAWILICTLSVKFSGGTDGLMEGNSLIAGIIFFLLSVRFTNSVTATVGIIFAGLILGFLFYNFYPAKIRSGSSGKSTYGFILAVLSLLSGAKFATAILILLLPLADFFIVIIRRYATHKPKNPLHLLNISDRTHLHHQLLELGMSEQRVAFTEYMITGFLGLLALAASGTYKALIVFGSILVVTFLINLLFFRAEKKRNGVPPSDGQSPEAKYSY